MPVEKEGSGSRSAIILAAVVVVVAVYMASYGLPTLTWAGARWAAASSRWLYEVPKPLPPVARQPAPEPQPQAKSSRHHAQPMPKDSALEAYGYEFIVPWSAKYKTVDRKNGTEFRFDSGQVIFVYDTQQEVDTLKALTAPGSAERDKFEAIFGSHAMNTNYALYQAVYNISPSQFSPFMSTADAVRLNVLLNWKLAFGRDARPGSYAFSFDNIRGFEFGDPSKGSVAVRAFDDHDQQVRLLFAVAAGSGAKLSQDEISAVLASFRIAPLAGS